MAYPGKPKYTLLSKMYGERDADKGEEDAPFISTGNGTSRHRIRTSRIQLGLQIGTFFFTAVILVLYFINGSPFLKSHSASGDGVLPVGMSRVNPSTAHKLQPCGLDSETAKANGCVFDLMTMAWLHRDCYDDELSEEFLEVASEPFFYDMEGTKPVKDYKELSEVKVMVWTTRKYHIFHCSYGWRMMHRSLLRGGVLESGLSSYHHTEHCTDQLMNQTASFDTVMTRINIDFPDC
ncbi:uncharacterized protein EAE98_000788 [Botrytis deweyae]|uniref:Uncharacterized protein n=2 Tax=Botrytis TaxID=33196 RepID=A0A4Z1JQV0_9HELO|nr:uncharacterized protein EAE98_000788 [Botrytis deweyae]KAF7934502.1 hypothetical protein EAE99_002953 [Botrytis elliptica]KAF7938450.1 hypothetical protein EAE98_000788 [Botrytis deweyae]TGO73960.1 hypothetical protein BELL_0318g00050 [Botrytis elliptica]